MIQAGQLPTTVVSKCTLYNWIPWRFRIPNYYCFADNKYWLTNLDGYLRICREAKRLDRNYTIDKFDCDDFSAVMYCYSRYKYEINGVARVMDFVSRHSYNLIATSDGKIYVLEPQTCEVYTLSSRPKRFYSLMFALIIW